MAAYDPKSRYYTLGRGTPIDEVIRRWADNEPPQKAYDDSMPQPYTPAQVWPFREFTWTREKARPGYARVGGKQVWLDGPLKWDALVADMKANGWDPKEPLHMKVGKNGKALVGEGNHRLAIAMATGLRQVPVAFHFEQNVSKTPEKEPKVEVKPDLAKRVVKRYVEKNKPRTPEEEEKIQDIMDLLGMG